MEVVNDNIVNMIVESHDLKCVILERVKLNS